MASLFSLSDDLLRRVLEDLPQSDAVALCATSKQLDAFYPTDVTRAFAPDAMHAEYTAMCEWIVKRRVSSFTLAVYVPIWNEIAPKVLAGTRFDRVTLAPNQIRSDTLSATPWIPDCATFVSGFVTDPRLLATSYRGADVKFSNMRTTPPHLVTGRLPHFPSVPGAEPHQVISCHGPIEGLDRLPLHSAKIYILNCAVGQNDVDHLARVETTLGLTQCTIDASVRPRAFAARDLLVSINAMRIIDTAACTTLVMELRGGDEYPDAIPTHMFPNLLRVEFSGYTYDRIAAFRFASLFPSHVKKTYTFDVFLNPF